MAAKTKESVYDAALSLFYRDGYNGTSLRDICAEANVRMSAVYYYYDSKHGLLYEILRRETEESTKHLLKKLDGVDGPGARLAVAIGAHVEWHTTRQKAASVCDAEMSRLEPPFLQEVGALRRAHESIFIEIIEQGIAGGEFHPQHAPILTRMLLSGATGVASWFRDDGEYEASGIAGLFSTVVLDGLKFV